MPNGLFVFSASLSDGIVNALALWFRVGSFKNSIIQKELALMFALMLVVSESF